MARVKVLRKAEKPEDERNHPSYRVNDEEAFGIIIKAEPKDEADGS